MCPPPRSVKRDGSLGRPLGKHLGPKSIRDAWTKALKATGIKRGTVYALGRHTYGSRRSVRRGLHLAPPGITGHEDITTTQRYVSLRGQELTADELRALGG